MNNIVIKAIAKILPPKYYQPLIIRLIEKLPFKYSPQSTLKILFEIENCLYLMEGKAAIEYNNGIHPKHKIMNYHKFFTDNIDAGAEVLDVGCGLGELTYHIACNTNAKITGIEIRPEKVEKAKKKYSHGRIKFLVGDITKFDIDSKYNIVILSNVLEHITNRTDFLCDIVSRTCPEKILIRVPLFDREWRVPLKKELNLDWRLDPEHKTEYTIQSFENEMKESGLSIKSMQIRWGEIWAVVKPD